MAEKRASCYALSLTYLNSGTLHEYLMFDLGHICITCVSSHTNIAKLYSESLGSGGGSYFSEGRERSLQFRSIRALS